MTLAVVGKSVTGPDERIERLERIVAELTEVVVGLRAEVRAALAVPPSPA